MSPLLAIFPTLHWRDAMSADRGKANIAIAHAEVWN
jgi:hypothetical protein